MTFEAMQQKLNEFAAAYSEAQAAINSDRSRTPDWKREKMEQLFQAGAQEAEGVVSAIFGQIQETPGGGRELDSTAPFWRAVASAEANYERIRQSALAVDYGAVSNFGRMRADAIIRQATSPGEILMEYVHADDVTRLAFQEFGLIESSRFTRNDPGYFDLNARIAHDRERRIHPDALKDAEQQLHAVLLQAVEVANAARKLGDKFGRINAYLAAFQRGVVAETRWVVVGASGEYGQEVEVDRRQFGAPFTRQNQTFQAPTNWFATATESESE